MGTTIFLATVLNLLVLVGIWSYLRRRARRAQAVPELDTALLSAFPPVEHLERFLLTFVREYLQRAQRLRELAAQLGTQQARYVELREQALARDPSLAELYPPPTELEHAELLTAHQRVQELVDGELRNIFFERLLPDTVRYEATEAGFASWLADLRVRAA